MYIYTAILCNIGKYIHLIASAFKFFTLTRLAILFVIKYLQHAERIGLDWVLNLPVTNT